MPGPIGPQQRHELWQCLKNDNAGALHRALKLYGFRTCEDLQQLELEMWHASGGKGPAKKRFGIAAVCAINVYGVPSGGAPRCLRMLFDKFGEAVLGTAEPEVLERLSSLDRPSVVLTLFENERLTL